MDKLRAALEALPHPPADADEMDEVEKKLAELEALLLEAIAAGKK